MCSDCTVSGDKFTVSDQEMALRSKFGFSDSKPTKKPKYRFQYVGAFYPQWHFHKRKCDKTGQSIISILRADCKYPIWQRDEWVKSANTPSREFDDTRPIFEQAYELFITCALPHNFQSQNQNCEYTDDWYRSKNCYLCQGGQNNENCRYCFASDGIKNVHNGIFAFDSDFCFDLINSSSCNNSIFILNSKNISDSAFLYDCRDCKDCMFCSNLRHKQYRFNNVQLNKDEFESKKKEWTLFSYQNYKNAIQFFSDMMKNIAWHRQLQIDFCESIKPLKTNYNLSHFQEFRVNSKFSLVFPIRSSNPLQILFIGSIKRIIYLI